MTELVTERLRLRPFRLSDLTAVQAYAGDPEVVRFLRWGPNQVEETRRFLVRAARAAAGESDELDLAITVRSTGVVQGGIAIHPRAPGRMEIGYVLARPAWGHGYASEAVRALLGHLGARGPAAEVFGLVVPGNEASVRVLTRCGFEEAGDPAPYREWARDLCATARVYRTRLPIPRVR